MPGKNIYKDYLEESYYHIYNRGVNKQDVFTDSQDFAVFLSLLKRYLGEKLEKNKNNVDYVNYSNEIELIAFCLMKNHFHLFIYQKESSVAITEFMRSLATSYSMYFNKRHKRVGPLFQQRYRAVRINDDAQLQHISRYIHLNPTRFKDYEWSSYKYYLGEKQTDWVKPERVLELFNGDYQAFVEDYKPERDELENLKRELADA